MKKDSVYSPLHGRLNPRIAKAVCGIDGGEGHRLSRLRVDLPNMDTESKKRAYADLFIDEAMRHPLYVRSMREEPDWACVAAMARESYGLVADCAERSRGVAMPRSRDFIDYLLTVIKQRQQ